MTQLLETEPTHSSLPPHCGVVSTANADMTQRKVTKSTLSMHGSRADRDHDFCVTFRGPCNVVDSFDLDSGFHISRHSRSKFFSGVSDATVHWISDGLKKNAFTRKYQLKEVIGEGTYAKVHRCLPNKHAGVASEQKEYAVKVMNKQQMISLGMAPFLKREVDILKRVGNNCPGVCGFVDFIETEKKYYLVLEYLRGGCLDREFTIFEEDDIRDYIFQIAQTLKYLHDRGIFHADLQLGNICKVNKSNSCSKVKLVDFGLSNYWGPDKRHSRFVGNLYYAAPEMLNGNGYDGPEIDIWALGVCLFKLATGYRPFKNSNCIISGSFMFSLEEEDVSDECKDLIRQILQVDATKRPSIDEILAHPFFDACRQESSI